MKRIETALFPRPKTWIISRVAMEKRLGLPLNLPDTMTHRATLEKTDGSMEWWWCKSKKEAAELLKRYR